MAASLARRNRSRSSVAGGIDLHVGAGERARHRAISVTGESGNGLIMMPNSTKITRTEGVLSRVLDGEAVLLDTEGGAYFGLNAVGTRAWELIGAAGTTKAALVDALLAEHEVTREVLERDIDDLLVGLEQRKLVRLARG